MKRFILFCLAIACGLTAVAQQDCSTYFPFKQGVKMEYTNYNKKDKVEGAQMHEISDIQSTDGGGISATVSTMVTDKKGKELQSGNYEVKCKDGAFYMDMTGIIPTEMMQGKEAEGDASAEIDIEQEGMVIPADLSVGQELPDASTTINLGSGGMNLMKMKVDMTDRKVEAKETLETPAGTFDCYKMSYTMKTKFSFVKNEMQSTQWYAEDIGMVRSETYNKKGKLVGYSVLTKFEKK